VGLQLDTDFGKGRVVLRRDQGMDPVGLCFDPVLQPIPTAWLCCRVASRRGQGTPSHGTCRTDAEVLGSLPAGQTLRNRRDNAGTQIQRQRA